MNEATSVPTIALYQPLLVGLIAVVLGFVANGLLELLKSKLEADRQLDRLRKALLFELNLVHKMAEATLTAIENGGANGEIAVVFRSSKFLHNLDRKEFGRLEFDELVLVNNVASSVESIDLMMVMMDRKTAFERNDMLTTKLPQSLVRPISELFSQVKENADLAVADIANRLGKVRNK